jgi:hypothetical protein
LNDDVIKDDKARKDLVRILNDENATQNDSDVHLQFLTGCSNLLAISNLIRVWASKFDFNRNQVDQLLADEILGSKNDRLSTRDSIVKYLSWQNLLDYTFQQRELLAGIESSETMFHLLIIHDPKLLVDVLQRAVGVSYIPYTDASVTLSSIVNAIIVYTVKYRQVSSTEAYESPGAAMKIDEYVSTVSDAFIRQCNSFHESIRKDIPKIINDTTI